MAATLVVGLIPAAAQAGRPLDVDCDLLAPGSLEATIRAQLKDIFCRAVACGHGRYSFAFGEVRCGREEILLEEPMPAVSQSLAPQCKIISFFACHFVLCA